MKTFTFYSFKGGVGRTALLMHLAVKWADMGKVVAVMDMDLNAPGVSYSKYLEENPDPELRDRGASDLMGTFYESYRPEDNSFGFFPPSKLLRNLRSHEGDKWGSQGRLLVMPAGQVTLPQFQTFNDAQRHKIPPVAGGTDDTPEQRALRAFAIKFREDMRAYRPPGLKRSIDYLLIDCRTGYPDLVDLTMGYLADRLILVSGLNQQNLHGLDLTLEALRHQRIRPGHFAGEMMVVFSPVPVNIHDQPEVRVALDAGIELVEKNRRPLPDSDQAELSPPIHTLPYTPHLAISDTPIPRHHLLGKLHPYWLAVDGIAQDLAPRSLEEKVNDLKKQIEQLTGIEIAIPTDRKKDRGLIDKKTLNSHGDKTPLAQILQLPKWYWPLAGDPQRIDSWRNHLPAGKNREPFLDDLCGATRSIAKKREIFEKFHELSQFQFDNLWESFQEERRRFAALDASQEEDLLATLFKHQLSWAQLLLNEDDGRTAMLLWPLQGRGVFKTWEAQPVYWRLLVATCQKTCVDPEVPLLALFQAGLVNAAIPPWGRLAFLEALPETNVQQAATLLDTILDQPLPENAWDCHQLIELFMSHWPTLAERLEPIIDFNKQLASKNSDPAIWHNYGYLQEVHFKRYDEAEPAYRQAIELDENFALSWNGLGNLFQDHLNQHEEAERAYRKAIEINQNFALPWNGLGNLFQYHLNRHEEAERAYLKAIEIDQNFAHPWNGLGNLFMNHLNRPDEAERAYRKAIEIDQNFALPWNGLGNLLQDHLNRHEEAERAYRKAIEIDQNDASPWNGLGNLFQEHLHRHEEAERAYLKAIEIDQNDALPWNGLGKLFQYRLNRHEKAERAYLKAVEIDQNDAIPWHNLGNLFQDHLNRHEEAERAYRKAIEIDQNFAHPWNGLGNLFQYHLNRHEEAERAYRKAIEIDQNFALPWNGLGNLFQYRLNRHEEAERAYRKAIEIDQKFATPWHNLGNLFQDHLNRHEDTERAYRKAIEIDQNFAHPWNGLGNLFQYRLNRHEEAERAYLKAIEIDQNFAHPWNGLGNLLQVHLNRHEEAERAYLKAIEIDQNFALPWNGLGNLFQDYLNRHEEAEQAYLKAIEIDQNFASPWNGLGNLFQYRLNRHEEAERAYLKAIEIDQNFAHPWNGLGNLFQYHLNRHEEAERAYRKAIEIDQNFASPWNGLGNLLQVHLNRHEEAERAYRKAIEIDPNNAFPMNGLGVLFYTHYKLCREALAHFDQGLQRQSDYPYLHMNRGHLNLHLGQPWRMDLATALSGFEKDTDIHALINRIRLAVELDQKERLPGADELDKVPGHWHTNSYFHIGSSLRGLALGEEIKAHLQQAIAHLNTHHEYRNTLNIFHLVAGARPDLREDLRKAAAFFYHLPAEKMAQLKGVPTPEILERYRPFIEGNSDGAGDPRERHLFCVDGEK